MPLSTSLPDDYGAAYAIPREIAAAVMLPANYKDEVELYKAFAWLRANQPLGRASLEEYDPIWIVTKHADIMTVERQQNLFHNIDDNPILCTQANDSFLRANNNGTCKHIASLVHMDPPEHAAIRKVTADYFSAAKIQALGAGIQELAQESVRDLLAGPKTVDFVRAFALHFPLRVIMQMLGIPRQEERRMLRLTQEWFGNNDPEERRSDVPVSPESAARQAHRVLEDFYGFFNTLTVERRRKPQADLISVIANHKVDGQYLSDFHINGYYISLATAGHDTTSSTIAGAMLALLEGPEIFAPMRAAPADIPGFIEEALRWVTPVRHFMRTATAHVEVRGRPIRKGDRLMLCYPSANRDEAVFPEAERFDPGRRPNRHLALGCGPHACLGQHLAKLEMKLLFTELLPHIASARRTGPARYVETNFVGGLKSLPIEFIPQ